MSSVFKQQLLNNLHFWVGQECPGRQSKGLEQGSGCLNLMPMLSAVIPSFEEKKKNCFAVRPAFFFSLRAGQWLLLSFTCGGIKPVFYYPDMNIVVYVFSCSPSKKTGHIPGYRFTLHLFLPWSSHKEWLLNYHFASSSILWKSVIQYVCYFWSL